MSQGLGAAQLTQQAKERALALMQEGRESEALDSISVPGASVLTKDYDKHQVAGEGTLFRKRPAKKTVGPVMLMSDKLPDRFVDAIHETHTATQTTDYLPQAPNLNSGATVGVVKPIEMIEEWIAADFDPWSASFPRVSVDFIPNLDKEMDERKLFEAAEKRADADPGVDLRQAGAAAIFLDVSGLAAAAADAKKEATDAKQLATVFSLCRHGKFEEIEAMLNAPEWILPIDAKDEAGNTLLHIAAQNNNKRIIKLCLRRGCSINIQNVRARAQLTQLALSNARFRFAAQRADRPALRVCLRLRGPCDLLAVQGRR
jgi:hypothetical protein